MLTLFYFPGSYSMAAHILLEESSERYELRRIDLKNGEQRGAAYRKINPNGLVPALLLESGEVITENSAILPFLGKRFGLWPTDPVIEARALSIIGFFATTVAISHACALHPERFALDPGAYASVKAAGLAAFHEHVKQIDLLLGEREWFLSQYSACDPYAFGFYTWGLRRSLPMRDLKNYTAFMDRMLQRPAVRRVVADEELRVV